MMIKTITIETIQAGQPSAYADSVYEAVLTFNQHREDQAPDDSTRIGYRPTPDTVGALVKILLHHFEAEPGPYGPRLEHFKEIKPGCWHVKIREPYCD
jgi:hypothetical protein